MLLLHLIQDGELSATLIKGALERAEMNLTQARLCYALYGESLALRVDNGMTLTRLCQEATVSSARAHIQLKKLQAAGVVRKISHTKRDGEGQLHRYLLTSVGLTRMKKFTMAAEQANQLLYLKVSNKKLKEYDTFVFILGRIREYLKSAADR